MKARYSYLLALLSGILLFLSYPPFNLEFLAWFAFVPVLVAIYYERKAERMHRLILVAGVFLLPLFLFIVTDARLFLPSVAVWPVTVITALLVVGYVVWPIEGYWKSKHLLGHGLSYLPPALQVLVPPVIATAIEFLVLTVPVVMKIAAFLGFASVSSTQWLNPAILRVSSFTGMYGVTFLVWLVNCALAYGIVHFKDTRRISKQVIAVLLIFAAIFVWGWVSLPEVSSGDTTVVIVQAKPATLEKEHINQRYADLTEHALKYEPELVLWSNWCEFEPFQKVGPFANEFADFCKEKDIYLTDGENIVSPDGSVRGYYMPYHYSQVTNGLVPFDLDKIVPDLHGFNVGPSKFGLLACSETGFPMATRKWVEGGARFVAGTSGNEPIIGASAGLFAGNMAYRAVEHRIYTAFFYRDNGSILVDPYGRMMEDIAPEPEIVAGKIAFTGGDTFYTIYGDVFGFVILALFVSLLSCNAYLKRKSPYTFCKRCKAQIEKGTEVCPECGKSSKGSWVEGTEIYKLWKKISKR